MAIEVQCGSCGQRSQVAEQYAGRQVYCQHCGAAMAVPQAAAAPVGPAPFVPPRVSPQSALPPPPPGVGYSAGASSFPPPAKRSRSSTGAIVLLIAGVALIVFGYRESRLAAVASATAQPISCADLEKNGPGNNAHVLLSDFLVSPGGYIYRHNPNDTSAGWSQAWIPVIPKNGAYVNSLAFLVAIGKADKSNFPKPTNVKVLIRSSHVKNADDVEAISRRGYVDGLVVNRIESLSTAEREHLQSEYPQTDFTKCWIIEDGRKPIPSSTCYGMMGAGAAALLLGIFLILRLRSA